MSSKKGKNKNKSKKNNKKKQNQNQNKKQVIQVKKDSLKDGNVNQKELKEKEEIKKQDKKSNKLIAENKDKDKNNDKKENKVKIEKEDKKQNGIKKDKKKILETLRTIVCKENIILFCVFIISFIISVIIACLDLSYNRMDFLNTVVAFTLLINIFTCLIYNFVKNTSKIDCVKCIVKVLFSVIITIILSYITKSFWYIIYGLLDILFIHILTNIIFKKFKKISSILNNILFFIYNLQICIFIFGNSYLNMNMLLNINSIKGIGGNLIIYSLTFVIVLIISCLKNKNDNLSKKVNILILVQFIGMCILMYVMGFEKTYSPLRNYKILMDEYKKYREEIEYFKTINVDVSDYYHENVEDFYKKDENLPEDVNVILIFTEGLSQHIIDDERDILPNIREYQNKSINFTNYYNHTFATYKGLIGQLYSGFNYTNKDVNKLPSIQSILKNKGYKTEFLNSEPKNGTFYTYLKSFEFMKLYNEWPDDCLDGCYSDIVSDRTMYETILKKANEYNENGDKFFLSMYTYGTHVTLDGVETKGENKLINKFSDLDKAFGDFMKEFEKSPIYDNTIIVFTTDHATYSDLEFNETFSNYEKKIQSIDRIPLFIYHKNVKAQNINVDERTTINLAPTILDYLDISDENYFIGESLFSGEKCENELDRVYYDGSIFKINDNRFIKESGQTVTRIKIIKYISLFKNKN